MLLWVWVYHNNNKVGLMPLCLLAEYHMGFLMAGLPLLQQPQGKGYLLEEGMRWYLHTGECP